MPLYIIIIRLISAFIFLVFVAVVWSALKHSSTLWMDGIIQITPIPCIQEYYQQDTDQGEKALVERRKMTTELCLPAKDVLALNNSIKLSESISLLGVFVAIVGLMLPVLGFLSLKHQKLSIETELEGSLTRKFLQLEYELKKSTGYLPRCIQAAHKFRLAYLDHRLRAVFTRTKDEDIKKFSDKQMIYLPVNEAIYELNEVFNEALQSEDALFNICIEDDKGVQQGFDLISNYIAPNDVLKNAPYIQVLKHTLGRFYLAGVFNSDAKRESLTDFLREKLMTDLVKWHKENCDT